MNINGAFPSNYLKAADLQGREVLVMMAKVEMEDIGGDHKPVLYFRGKEKGMVLNKTNANNISMVYGQETEAWEGKEIVLYPAWVDFQGRSVEAIRVRPPSNRTVAQHRIATAAQSPNGGEPRPAPPPPSDPRAHALDDDIPF